MYIAIPYELYDAWCEEEITNSMYCVMEWLLYRADWATGRVKNVCAETIHHQIGKQESGKRYSVRTIQDAMRNLNKCGWITSHQVQGHRGSYWVTIHNYTVLMGELKNTVVNLKTVTPYNNGEPERCADSHTDDGSDSALTVRGRCADDGSDGATIQETPESSASSSSSEPQRREAFLAIKTGNQENPKESEAEVCLHFQLSEDRSRCLDCGIVRGFRKPKPEPRTKPERQPQPEPVYDNVFDQLAAKSKAMELTS